MTTTQRQDDFSVGQWRVSIGNGTVTDGTSTHHLEPRPMDVLAYLASNVERVVSRDELIREVWGVAAISDGAVTRCIGAIRKALQDNAYAPKHVLTIPKRGYRLVSPPQRSADSPRHVVSLPRTRYLRQLAAAACLLSLSLAAVVALLVWPDHGSASITVEPFRNLDTTADQEHWGEGVTEEVLERLASQTAMTVHHGAGRETVDWVLSGAVRRQGERARLSCQLKASATGIVECAGVCEASAGDRLAAQTELANHLVEAIALVEDSALAEDLAEECTNRSG